MHVHHSNSLEALAGDVAARVRQDPVDPFVAERIVVSHPTMRRWLNLELARANGIAANYRFELPAQFGWSMMRDVAPDLPDRQPFAPENLRWRLFDMLPGFTKKPVAAPVRRYLEDGDPSKRFDLCGEIARMYDRCLLYRPQWIREWEAGDTPHWQARLWQELVASAGKAHWVSALDRFHAALDEGAVPDRWPRRVTFFAVPALSPSYLDLLRRIASRVEIHYCLINPCRQYWGDIFTRFETVVRSGDEDPDTLHMTEGNELLAAWGRIGRDTFDSLVDMMDVRDVDRFVEPDASHLLADLQRDILDLKLARDQRVEGVKADHSLQVHACHSATREAEVLHDCLLDLFERHGDIQPADVHILTPDPERYDPAIASVFESRGQIPVTFTRRRTVEAASLRAFLDLLDLVRSRYGAEEVMGPLDAPLVCRSFGIEVEDLVDIRRWVQAAEIRWGVDAQHRTDEGQVPESLNTWSEGLRRLLLGYAVADHRRTLFDVAPCPLESASFRIAGETDYQVLGCFVSYCEAVFGLRRRLGTERRAADWVVALHDMVDRFFVPAAGRVQPEEADEIDALKKIIGQFEDQATQASEALSFEVVRDVLHDLANTPSPDSAWLGEGVTLSRLAEGQPLPSRIVCLVGMNGDSFPATARPSTFDLVATSPRQRGDRDIRYEDRFSVIEALLAARTGFIVTYSGRGIRDDAPIPPSVVVDELTDYLAERFPDAGFRTDHSLQPFDSRYFRDDTDFFSYAAPMCDMARALTFTGDPHKDPRRFRAPLILPDADPLTVGLAQLERFFANPAGAFLRERLGISLARTDIALEEEDRFSLDKLESYQLRSDIAGMSLAGMRPGEIRKLLIRSGRLPPGESGAVLIEDEFERARELADLLAPFRQTLHSTPTLIDIKVAGCRVIGSVPHTDPEGMVWWRPGKFRPIDRIGIHLRQLALAAGDHEKPEATAVHLEDKEYVKTVLAEPTESGLEPWLDAFREGLRSPLPFAPRTTFAWMEKEIKNSSDDAIRNAVDNAWQDGFNGPGEGSKPEFSLVWDRHHPMDLGFDDWLSLLEPLVEG